MIFESLTSNYWLRKTARNLLIKTSLLDKYDELRRKYKNSVAQQRLDEIKRSGYLNPPYDIILETNFSCNLKCFFCYQRKVRLEKEKAMTYENIKDTFTSIDRREIRSVSIMGGESFVRTDILKIFDLFEKMNIPFNLTTNGTLLNDKLIDKLCAYKYLNYVVFSIHGWEKTHDDVVGFPRAFKRAYRAMELLAQKRKGINLSFVFTENNIQDLIKVIEGAKKAGLDEVILAPVYTTSIYIGKKDSFAKVDMDKGHRRLIDGVREAKAYAKANNVLISHSSNLMRDEFMEYYVKGEVLKNRERLNPFCSALFETRIDPKGQIVYCLLSRRVFGNVKETPLKDLVNSREIMKVRKAISNSGYYSICERCCKFDTLNTQLS